eukprot:TRINITY_DN48899_c0_g1_i2.p1 TRINITY_DN48899_c0_g1~~TRINITY_DN48899_c0_g1_i2.p1  ORF type:complete len:348 (+),score=65.20 TRINITY_DN48899_c0_g1_i2:142-1185(+)
MCIRDSINAEYGDCPRFMADPLDKGFQDYLKQHDPQEPPARQRTVLPDSILKVLLYGTAPFFSYPFKPMLEAAEGNGYAVAYRHFRRDHQDPHNLLYHCLCLVFQVRFNFSFLAEMDKLLPLGGSMASSCTFITWIWQLSTRSTAPALVRLLSVGTVATAYMQREVLGRHWKMVAFLTGLLEMVGVQIFLLNKKVDTSGKHRKPTDFKQLGLMMLIRTLVQIAAMKWMTGALSTPWLKRVLNLGLLAWLARCCRDPMGPSNPFRFGFFGWLLAILTDQPWMYFFSGGFLATVCQGISHHMAGEEGTLPQLARTTSGLRSELSHVSFFPNLLLHSCYQSITGIAPTDE